MHRPSGCTAPVPLSQAWYDLHVLFGGVDIGAKQLEAELEEQSLS